MNRSVLPRQLPFLADHQTPVRRLYGTALVALGAFCGLLSTSPVAAQSLWEFDPYRIRLVVAFEDDTQFTSERREQIKDEVCEQIEAYIGAPWEVDVVLAAGSLQWRMLSSLSALAAAEVMGENNCDKAWLAVVRRDTMESYIEVREYDTLTQHWGPLLRREVPRIERLSHELFRALLAVFAPLAEIDAVEESTAQLRWRAGMLPSRDPQVLLFQVGDVLEPYLRSTDRDGNTRKVQNIDWTYLAVTSVEGGSGTATVYTGLRSPLARRKRGRVQQLALAVRSEPGVTQLQLRSRSEDAQPLVGYEVYAYAPDSPATTLLGYSDADGFIDIPPGAARLRLLLIKNGNELLARVPVVPGLKQHLELRLADDAPRLAAEGFLIGLQERLIDVVVRRHVLIARIKLRIEQGQLDDASRLMDELRRMDSQQQFLLALDQQQQKSLASDPVVQRKIEKMFATARELVGQYLDPRDVNRMEIELDRARKAQASAPPSTPTAN
jgi:hypothetical protein